MNTSTRTVSAALLVIAAVSGLAGCGEAVDLAPAASVREEIKPSEHQAYKDLAASRQHDLPVKPFEHQLRRGSR